ncbi:MAG: DoxX family protein [Nitrososphaerota archaeon]
MVLLGFLEPHMGFALLMLRGALGLIMVVHGAPKLFGPARPQMRASMSQIGVPPLLFDSVGLLEFLGGIFLIAGFLTRIVALLFALQMIGTIILYVSVLGRWVPPPEIMSQMVANSRRVMRGFISGVGGWEFDLLILCVSILLLTTGAGPISLDAAINI